MDINSDMATGGISGPTGPRRSGSVGKTSAGSTAKKASETPSFGASASLDQSLKALPDVRPEALDLARGLVEDTNYPSQDALQKISSLLVKNINEPSE